MAGPNSMIVILMMFGVFYFIVIRPQTKFQKGQAAMRNSLSKGDKVVTRGGLIGTITGVKDNELVVEIQEKVRVRVLRTHVDGKYDPESKKDDSSKAA